MEDNRSAYCIQFENMNRKVRDALIRSEFEAIKCGLSENGFFYIICKNSKRNTVILYIGWNQPTKNVKITDVVQLSEKTQKQPMMSHDFVSTYSYMPTLEKRYPSYCFVLFVCSCLGLANIPKEGIIVPGNVNDNENIKTFLCKKGTYEDEIMITEYIWTNPNQDDDHGFFTDREPSSWRNRIFTIVDLVDNGKTRSIKYMFRDQEWTFEF